MKHPHRVGVVVIGHNEGPRLAKAIRSVRFLADACVYVDSASSDTSASVARRLGAHVVELDRSTPLTAARARNAGFARLMELDPGLDFVQFVDGDCQVVRGWLHLARRELTDHPNLGVVCGETREVDAKSSVFKRLMDMELELPSGEVDGCHGNAMYRCDALHRSGNFNEDLIAGEEGDLCQRIRGLGYRIRKLDTDMVFHDIGLDRFTTWWRRAMRNGYAYVSRAFEGEWTLVDSLKNIGSIVLWAVLLPLVALMLLAPSQGLSLLALALYPIQILRITRHKTRTGRPIDDSIVYAVFTMLQKFVECIGLATYALGLRAFVVSVPQKKTP